jgi:hypothetical protein
MGDLLGSGLYWPTYEREPAVDLTRAMGGDMTRPGDAVGAFLIPVVSIYRPYRVVRDLHDSLAPELVDNPPPEVRADGYRTVQIKAPPTAKKIPYAYIGAWWGTFWATGIIMRLAADGGTRRNLDTIVTEDTWSIVAAVIALASTVLGVTIVRSITARLVERFRRIRHSTIESLEEQRIELRGTGTRP